MSDVFEALVAPARRAILDVLCERDGQTLFEICARLAMRHGVSLMRQAISQHLEVLESAGLLRIEREGRYKLKPLFGVAGASSQAVAVDVGAPQEMQREAVAIG